MEKINVIYIEDNPDDIFIMEAFMEDIPLVKSLEISNSLNDGLQTLQSKPFSVILLDLSLPDSFGLDTIHEVMLRHEEIPIIVFTGLQDEKVALEAIKIGAQDYLVKGEFDDKVLKKTLFYALERHKFQKDLVDQKNKLSIAQTRLEKAEQLAKVGNWEIDVQTKKATVSDGTKRLFGFEMDSSNFVNSEDYINCLFKEGRLRFEALMLGEEGTGQSKNYQERILTKDGQVKNIETWLQIQKNLKGEVTKIFGASLDITERVKDQNDLKENQELLAHAQHLAHMGSWRWVIKSNKLFWSDELYRVYGYQPKQITPSFEKYLNFVHPDDRNYVQTIISNAIQNKNSFNIEERITDAKGHVKFLRTWGNVIINQDGEVESLFGACLDVTKEKTNENKLKQSRERLIEAQDLANIGNWEYNFSNANFLYSNQVKIIFDVMSNNHFTIKDILRMIHPDDLSQLLKKIKSLLNFNEAFLIDVRVISIIGQLKYLKITGKVAVDDKNKKTHIRGVLQDITELRKAEKIKEQFTRKLEDQYKRNRQLISTTLDGYILTSETGEIIETNNAYSQMVGYTPTELIGKKINNIESTTSLTAYLNRIKILEETGAVKYETKHVSKDGLIITLEVSVAAIKDVDKPTFVAYFVRNISERKEAEIRQSIFNRVSQHLNLNIDVFSFCQFIEKELNKVFSVDKFYVLLYNKNKNQLNSIYVSDDNYNGHENIIRKGVNGLSEYVIKSKKGIVIDNNNIEYELEQLQIKELIDKEYHWMVAPLITGDEVMGTIKICTKKNIKRYVESDLEILEFIGVHLGTLIHRKETDHTIRLLNSTLEERVEIRTKELIKAQEELALSLSKEKELNDLKSQFVSTASHQFRTPLTVINSNMGLLEMQDQYIDEEFRPKFRKISGRIKSEVSRMTELMNDVLILGKIGSGNLKPKFSSVDIAKLCQSLAFSYSEIQEDGREAKFEVLGESRNLYLDESLIEHAISNIISNAFKYSEGRESPQIIVSFDEKKTSIKIKDFGLGIPKQDLSNIFEPFYRAGNVQQYMGTGLGTAIAKDYVELNNGKIKFESQVGEGTTFYITFNA